METAPETTEETQWNTLVSYWYSEEAKAISNKNKDNSKNIKYPRMLGRKSFARKRKELEDALGKEVDRATFFDECHKTKDGVYVNALTEEKMNEVYMKLAEKKLDGHELTEEDYEKAMKDVFGKDHPGRVRGMGPTITPSKYFGGRFSTLSRDEPGTSSSSSNDLMKFVLSYLAKKYPEDDLLSRLPPHVRRQLVAGRKRVQLSHSNSTSTSEESPEGSQD